MKPALRLNVIMILLVALLSTIVLSETNISVQYGWNGTDYIPIKLNSEGAVMTDIDLINITNGWLVAEGKIEAGTNISAPKFCIGSSCRTSWPSSSTGKIGDEVYLYNDSTTMYFNETKLNATIEALSINSYTDTNTWWSVLNSLYLYNDSNVLKVNETKLNATIEALSINSYTDTNTWWGIGSSQYLYNDSNTLKVNETKLNETIDVRKSNHSINYGNNGTDIIPFKLDGSGILQMDIASDVAEDLTCTDCIGATEIEDVYVLNSGDEMTGDLDITGDLHVDGIGNFSGTVYAHNFSGNSDITFINSTDDELMTITEDGKIGIGTTSPSQLFEVEGTTTVARFESTNANLFIQLANSGGIPNIRTTADLFSVADNSGNQKLNVNVTSGNIGIGTTAPGAMLEIKKSDSGNTPEFIRIYNPTGALATGGEIAWYAGSTATKQIALRGIMESGGYGGLGIYTSMGNVLGFYQNKLGYVGIGTTIPSRRFNVVGDAEFNNSIYNSGIPTSTGDGVQVQSDGQFVRVSSSRRYKYNITPIEDNTSRILELEPVSFTWNNLTLDDGKRDIGFIAEDVDEIIPNLVSRDKEGNPSSVRYSLVSVYLLDVIKKQDKDITQLKEHNEQLISAICGLDATAEVCQ